VNAIGLARKTRKESEAIEKAIALHPDASIETIKDYFKHATKEHGIDQAAMAKELGVSRETVNRWMVGHGFRSKNIFVTTKGI
jgi:transcriptional regulator with PAS, ATPase and Fis domain